MRICNTSDILTLPQTMELSGFYRFGAKIHIVTKDIEARMEEDRTRGFEISQWCWYMSGVKLPFEESQQCFGNGRAHS